MSLIQLILNALIAREVAQEAHKMLVHLAASCSARLRVVSVAASSVCALLIASPAATEESGRCTAANSTMVFLEDVRLRGPENLPACVAVSGLIAPGDSFPFVLYEGIDAVYSTQTTRDVRQIYYRGGPEGSLAPWHLMPVTLYGRPDICRSSPIQPDGEILIVECWDPLIEVDTFEFTGPPPTRLLGESERVRVGNLSPAATEWPPRVAAKAAFERWMADLRSGEVDRGVLAEGSIFPLLRALVTDPYDEPPSQEPTFFLVSKFPPDPGSSWSALGCVCLIDSCEGIWPISTIDADNNASRPYACLPIRGWAERAEVDDVRPWNGLVEPAGARQ
ncbi:MAG: hypothetical protein EOO23_06200 [Comamonadaceae bacterium]|nr:MAG: hypothetical protein EOO23_06200 [Comamonadaceae bacterium]